MADPHWQYLISLDNDLEELSRYIELNRANYKTFSVELVRLLLATCSELDVVAKALCEKIDPIKKRKDLRSIDAYRLIIRPMFKKFHTILICGVMVRT